jgi:hypothetical protein
LSHPKLQVARKVFGAAKIAPSALHGTPVGKIANSPKYRAVMAKGTGASGRKVWDHPRRAEFTRLIVRFRYLEMLEGLHGGKWAALSQG